MTDNLYDDMPLLQLIGEVDAMAFEDVQGHPMENHEPWQQLKRRLMREGIDPLHLMYAMVERFNVHLIGVPVPDRPRLLSPERSKFRIDHMHEELEETESAVATANFEEVVDGHLDLIYVALGALVEMGITVGAAFDEVHLANMLRKRAANPERPGSGSYDAIKPFGWKPPDLIPYLNLTREQVHYLAANAEGHPAVPAPMTLDERIRAKRREIQRALDAGDHALARTLDREERVLWARSSDDPVLGVAQEDIARGDLLNLDMATGHIRRATSTKPRRPRLLVVGHARHGKDTVCEMLRDKYDFRFTSSSLFCAEHVVLPKFEGVPGRAFLYKDFQECFDDRINHRKFWYDAIAEFNRPDPTALAKAVLEEHDVYCGMRSSTELHACKNIGLFDHIIWVDASQRVGPEDRSSCTVEPWMADFVIDANGTVEEAATQVDLLMGRLL